MLNYFINSKEQQKLTILQYILFSDTDHTSSEICQALGFKPTTFRRYILELKDDLLNLFENTVQLEINDKQKIHFNLQGDITLDYLLITLQLSYIEKSTFYAILTALIRKKYSSISDIAYDLHFSEPTVYKAISQLKSILHDFDAKVNFESNNNFDGNEIGVRYFLYIVYWNLFYTLKENPFSDNFPKEFIDLSFLKKSLGLTKELSHSQKIKLKMMAGISSYRLVFFQKKADLTEEFIEEISFFYNGTPCLNLSGFNVASDVIENESKLFSFFVRGLIFDIDDYPSKKRIVNQYLDSKLPIASAVSTFLEFFKTDFSLEYTEETYVESYYILILSYLYVKHFHFNVDDYFAISIKENIDSFKLNTRYQQIMPKLQRYLTYLPFDHSINNVEEDTFLSLLYVIYEMNSTPFPISIYVMNTANIVNATLIKTALLKTFNPELLNFCETPEHADIIITNTFEGNYPPQNIFYFENIYNQDTWKDLISFITDYLHSVIFPK
ncbi:helix-turn-helix domain-containing protein [Enterococcus faecalis]|uniref:helix-turn-helix domain-containing protein n=1 Tax=Enterococcus faecalis TaxID=1351 RepID=UPI003984939C